MIEEFMKAFDEAGLPTTHTIVPDGQLHRYHVKGDKRGSANGWYVLYGDNIPSGVFGSWKYGVTYRWCSRDENTLSASERNAIDERRIKANKQRECEQEIKQEEARHQADDIWCQSNGISHASHHPYLLLKKVTSHGLGFYRKKLVVPMFDIDGNLRSLQFISNKGEKRFLSGGRKKGCFFLIGDIADALCICEGYATGASIHEATGHAVAIAFDAGNLKPVALALREQYPRLKMLVCADNDAQTKGNPGLTKAKEAASSIGALLAVPPCTGDFNDWYSGLQHGAE